MSTSTLHYLEKSLLLLFLAQPAPQNVEDVLFEVVPLPRVPLEQQQASGRNAPWIVSHQNLLATFILDTSGASLSSSPVRKRWFLRAPLYRVAGGQEKVFADAAGASGLGSLQVRSVPTSSEGPLPGHRVPSSSPLQPPLWMETNRGITGCSYNSVQRQWPWLLLRTYMFVSY